MKFRRACWRTVRLAAALIAAMLFFASSASAARVPSAPATMPPESSGQLLRHPFMPAVVYTGVHEDLAWRRFMERVRRAHLLQPHSALKFRVGKSSVLLPDGTVSGRYGGSVQLGTEIMGVRGFVYLDRRAIGYSVYPTWYDVMAFLSLGSGHRIGVRASGDCGVGWQAEIALRKDGPKVFMQLSMIEPNALMAGRIVWGLPQFGVGVSWSE